MNNIYGDADDPADSVIEDSQVSVVRRLAVGLLEVHAARFDPSGQSTATDAAMILLAEAATGIETTLSLHRRVAPSTSVELVDFGEILLELCQHIARGMARAHRFDLRVDIASRCMRLPSEVVRLFLIATEVIINAIEHAHPAGIPGAVEVSCLVDAAGTLVLTVSDDGIGLPVDFDPRVDGGLGLTLIRSLGRRLGATVSYDSVGLGLQVTVTMSALRRPH